jgi:hypothetical protein
LEEILSGGSQFGIIVGGAEWMNSLLDTDINNAPMEDYSIQQFVNADPSRLDIVKLSLEKEKQGDKGHANLMNQLRDTVNPRQAEDVIERIKQYEYAKRISEESGWGGWLIGAAGAISIDMVAASLTGLPALVGGATLVTNSARSARQAAGLRMMRFGAAEGGFEQLSQAATAPELTVEDVMIATGLGGFLGALLGPAFPKFFGNVISKESMLTEMENTAKLLQQTEDVVEGRLERLSAPDAGAAATKPGTSLTEEIKPMTATTGTASIVVDKVLNSRWGKKIRTPKRRFAEVIARATKDRQKGLGGNDRLSAVLGQMYKISTLVAEDLAGEARQETMQEAIELMQTRLTIHMMKARNIYDEFTVEVFDANKLKNAATNSVITGSAMKRFKDQLPTAAEFRRVADQYAQARGEGSDPQILEEILDQLADKIPLEKRDQYVASIKKMADHDDAYYLKFGEAEAELQFINGDELKPGYRPQNWNTEYINAHQTELTENLVELFAPTPQMEWVEAHLESFMMQAAKDEAAVSAPLITPETTWDELKETLDPTVVRDIQDSWDQGVRIARLDALEGLERDLEKRLGMSLDGGLEQVSTNVKRKISRYKRMQADLQEELEANRALIMSPSTRVPQGRPALHLVIQRQDEIATTMSRVDIKMAEAMEQSKTLINFIARRNALKDALTDKAQIPLRRPKKSSRGVPLEDAGKVNAIKTQDLRSLREEFAEFILEQRIASRATKKLAKQFQKATRSAGRERAKLSAYKSLKDAAGQVARQLGKNRTPGGFHVDDALETSRHFKHRSLDLKDVRHKEKWRKFLNTDSEMNMEIYSQAVGRQLEMRRKYMRTLQENGLVDLDKPLDVFEGLLTYVQRGFRDDVDEVRRQGGPNVEEEVQRLEADLNDANDFLEKAFGEFTRSDYLKWADSDFDRIVSIAQSSTSAMALGKVALTMIADVAIMAFAGSRFGVGIKDMLFTMRNNGVLAAIEEDNEMLAYVLKGERNIANGVGVNRFDTDAASFETHPGSMLAKTQRVAQSVAQMEMKANLMQYWNTWVRSTFGIGFMRQITKDLADYDNLAPEIVGFYAKHGIGKAEAKRMLDLYSKHSKDINGITVPDLEAWANAGSDDLVERFYRAVNGAGNEALLDPGLGDRPFLRAHPMGRLVLQFQSFTFTAGERWFAPMIQQGMINPTDVRFLMSGMLGLTMAMLGNHARELLAGEEPTLYAAMDGDGQAFWEMSKNAWLRSPLVTGFQAPIIDILGAHLAKPVNEMYQQISGTDGELLNSEYTRYKQGQGIFALAGPAFGMTNTLIRGATNVIEGDYDGALSIAEARTPLANALPLIILRRFHDQLTQGE